MRRSLKVFACAAASLTLTVSMMSCGSSENTVDSQLFMAEDVQGYIDSIDMEYAYDLAETLAYDEEYWDNELGWRTAGSDAEHRAADFLVEEMKSIGLTDVEKVGTTVDKFQFNDSSLTIEGTDIDLMPASYQCSGTDADGITAEIVDVGTGFEADYEGKDVSGKIVLAGVDQWNEAWIDNYIRQAYGRGAAAIVTYSTGGYGELNDDTVNVQDICCGDLIPTVAISANQAKEIQDAIEAGNDTATLMVDAVLEEGTGVTYNVVGKIKGRSSDQQILIAGHYDKYWYGFQDDSAAIALDFAVAKAMIDSGYVPENDIVVVAHGAEEWGATDTQFDYTTGAWGMMHEAELGWDGKTLAMLNCELPAFAVEGDQLNISCVPEFASLVSKMVTETGLVTTAGDVVVSEEAGSVNVMEDGVSYRWHGVPYILNGFEDDTFMQQRYHTSSDDKDTWDEDTMRTNINWFGAFAIYIDSMPALELDITAACDDLENNFDEEVAQEAGVDTEAYLASIDSLRTVAKEHNDRIADVNARYEEAVSGEASEEELSELRAEGAELNQATLEAFKTVQTQCTKTDDVDVYTGHPNLDANINGLKGMIEALQQEELYAEDEESGALDIAWTLNGEKDYSYYLFDQQVVEDILVQYDASQVDDSKAYWALDKMIPVCYVGDATYQLVRQAEDEDAEIDYDAAIAIYQSELDRILPYVKTYCDEEVAAMAAIEDILK